MSATIPETMLLSDLLKSTGYDCPEKLQGKTVAQIVAAMPSDDTDSTDTDTDTDTDSTDNQDGE